MIAPQEGLVNASNERPPLRYIFYWNMNSGQEIDPEDPALKGQFEAYFELPTLSQRSGRMI